MRGSKFSVTGRLDQAGGSIRGTVIIDRKLGLFAVRPYRRRRTYELPLSTVADWVCRSVVVAEVKLRQAAKRKAKI